MNTNVLLGGVWVQDGPVPTFLVGPTYEGPTQFRLDTTMLPLLHDENRKILHRYLKRLDFDLSDRHAHVKHTVRSVCV